MPIFRPDEYKHNNPNLALLDSEAIRGGRRTVATLSNLYTLADKIDLLKEGVTIVRVLDTDGDGTNVATEYLLVDINNIGSTLGWEVYDSGGSSGGDTVSGDSYSKTESDDRYEPKISTKGTAFNQNFGTALNDVSRGNHSHTPAQIGAEPSFSKNTAFNKNFGTVSGTITEGNDERVAKAVRYINGVLTAPDGSVIETGSTVDSTDDIMTEGVTNLWFTDVRAWSAATTTALWSYLDLAASTTTITIKAWLENITNKLQTINTLVTTGRLSKYQETTVGVPDFNGTRLVRVGEAIRAITPITSTITTGVLTFPCTDKQITSGKLLVDTVAKQDFTFTPTGVVEGSVGRLTIKQTLAGTITITLPAASSGKLVTTDKKLIIYGEATENHIIDFEFIDGIYQFRMNANNPR